MDAAEHLVNKCGADKVYIIATHGVLSGDAIEKIEACKSVYKVILKSPLYINILLLFTLLLYIVGCYQYFPYSQGKDGEIQ